MRKRLIVPEIFNKEDFQILLSGIDDKRVMMATLLGYFLGMRISEVVNTKKSDFVLNSKEPYKKIIKSKFNKDRNVPILFPKFIPIIVFV